MPIEKVIPEDTSTCKIKKETLSRKLQRELLYFEDRFNPKAYGDQLRKCGVIDILVDEVLVPQYEKKFNEAIRLAEIKTYLK